MILILHNLRLLYVQLCVRYCKYFMSFEKICIFCSLVGQAGILWFKSSKLLLVFCLLDLWGYDQGEWKAATAVVVSSSTSANFCFVF